MSQRSSRKKGRYLVQCVHLAPVPAPISRAPFGEQKNGAEEGVEDFCLGGLGAKGMRLHYCEGALNGRLESYQWVRATQAAPAATITTSAYTTATPRIMIGANLSSSLCCLLRCRRQGGR